MEAKHGVNPHIEPASLRVEVLGDERKDAEEGGVYVCIRASVANCPCAVGYCNELSPVFNMVATRGR